MALFAIRVGRVANHTLSTYNKNILAKLRFVSKANF